MNSKGFVTLAIHTQPVAYRLKSKLQAHNIEVRLESVAMPFSRQSIGLRVQVKLIDLPLALNLVESDNTANAVRDVLGMEGLSRKMLIPVDFSDSSMLAVKMGFELAARLNLLPLLLHAFVAPVFNPATDFTDISETDPTVGTIEAVAQERELSNIADKSMERFRQKIVDAQNAGKFVEIKFDVEVDEGIPEEVIVNYTRVNPPAIVVMATRGKDKKEEELIGSVTAEVLDSCRVPVFTVPENYKYTSISDIKNLAIFCNLDRQDVLTVDALMTMFDNPEVSVTLIPVDERVGSKTRSRLESLCDYLAHRYVSAKFNISKINPSDFRKELDGEIEKGNIQLLIVPNKKTNIFSRIFKPTMAHRFLFERDMPLLAYPV